MALIRAISHDSSDLGDGETELVVGVVVVRPEPQTGVGAEVAEDLPFRELVRLRRTLAPLARGGVRWVHVDADTIAFLRETHDERLLCVASRIPIDQVPGPFTELEPLYDSPQFQIWRIHG